LNSVFAQYKELSSPQFAVINLSLRLITANFGLDNSSYRAQPHSIIVNYCIPVTVCDLTDLTLCLIKNVADLVRATDGATSARQKSLNGLSVLVNAIEHRRN
jgi:hypothetical protein